MKKLIYSTLALGLVFSLSSFSSIKENKISVNELDSNHKLILRIEASSFTAYEDGDYKPDKSTWSYRHKTWTEDFTQSDSNSTLENIITRN